MTAPELPAEVVEAAAVILAEHDQAEAAYLDSLAAPPSTNGTAPAADRPSSSVVEVDELLAMPEPEYRWLVPELLERRDRLIVTGPEGKGKSTLLRQMALQLASGLHPFTLDHIDPLRVLVVDVENTRPQVRRKLPELRAAAGERYGQRCWFWFGPGLDLLRPTDQAAIGAAIDEVRPDVLIVGPLYKIAGGDPKDEQPARALASYFDHLRDRHDLALVIEAHTPYAEGSKARRPERPYGASLWSRWPEFGIFLSPEGDLRHWRGQREERSWPAKLTRGGLWPWTVDAAAVDVTPWHGPTQAMAAVLDVLAANPDGLSGSRLVDAMRGGGHSFRNDTIREAAERLAQDGAVSVRSGPRGARIYSPSPTLPHRPPGALGEGGVRPSPTVPHPPLQGGGSGEGQHALPVDTEADPW